nr:MFS transporter [Solirubrobacterales bacterium]
GVAAAALPLGLAVGAAFILRQSRVDSPLLDLGLLRRVRFSAALAINFLSFFAIFGLSVLEAELLQGVIGLSPLAAGLWSLPGALGFVVGSMVPERLGRRHPPVSIVTGSLLVGAAGLGLIAVAGGGLIVLVTGPTVMALGLAPVATLAADLVVSAAPPERAGSAAALNETSFELGGALGIAVLGSVLAVAYRLGLPAGVPDSARDSIGGAVAASHELGAAGLLESAREAFLGAYQLTAAVSSALLVAAAFVAVRFLGDGREREDATPFDGLLVPECD